MRVNNDKSTSATAQPAGTSARANNAMKPVSLAKDSYTSSAAATAPKPSPHKGILGDFKAVVQKLEGFISSISFVNAMQRNHKEEEKHQEQAQQDAKDAQFTAREQQAAQAQAAQQADAQRAAAAKAAK